jgi:cobalamin biosynthesis Mg chelatase CobN
MEKSEEPFEGRFASFEDALGSEGNNGSTGNGSVATNGSRSHTDGLRPSPTPTGADHASSHPSRLPPAYDAVDLAMMAASARRAKTARRSNRYLALVIVVVLFLMLLFMGLWLSAQVRSNVSNTGGATRPNHASAPSPPRSPRR